MEAITINIIIERKILIRSDSIDILKFLTILNFLPQRHNEGTKRTKFDSVLRAFLMNLVVRFSFANSFIKLKSKHYQNRKQDNSDYAINPVESIF